MAFRGSVVRRDIGGKPTTWIASINSTGLGEFLEREIAMLLRAIILKNKEDVL
jgi:hypothetical protein